MTRICLIPNLRGVGGPASFQLKLAAGLNQRGIQVCYDLDELPYDALLITGGTRHLSSLGRVRRRGVRIVQRLDGINWIHRRKWVNLFYFFRAEFRTLLLQSIRLRYATHIVYQSNFVRDWWHDWFGEVRLPHSVIHNGVDLGLYTPDRAHSRPKDRVRMLVVEGSLADSLTAGLDTAVELANSLSQLVKTPLELQVVGRVDPRRQAFYERTSQVPIKFSGIVPRESIPEIDRSAHLLFSAEVNAPCPNSVIEALACGLPVVGFKTGALPELVLGDAGRLVPYGGNPWKLEHPDIDALASAAREILSSPERFRRSARKHAESSFSLDRMVDCYLEVLLG